ncbi:hypothetical protein Tter_2849 [Thermobaculum terrenum ATCC BAA-798]|uniref:Uncharacterized protein n=1 Tax=Thermobaculum terrenum (strain ATCC BAA-798 / CCMEE 7001 / YNP1) TaxID=525904 RepID=D1CJ12_THET1|nr:hypothetical protein [Thermobaculum terrenum]ACZ43732.1 hypothetical protein Tter_2849 [Thermobaculum terrenum ATCC BAA-798]
MKYDIAGHNLPVMVLLDPDGNGEEDSYQLPSWKGYYSTGHYITINGYDGTFDGTDVSASLYYRDTFHMLPDNTKQFSYYLRGFAYLIRYKNGVGSCSSNNYDLIW